MNESPIWYIILPLLNRISSLILLGEAKKSVAAEAKITDHFGVTKDIGSGGKKVKKKMSEEQKLKRMLNRFNGMTEEEVSKRGLPDYLR